MYMAPLPTIPTTLPINPWCCSCCSVTATTTKTACRKRRNTGWQLQSAFGQSALAYIIILVLSTTSSWSDNSPPAAMAFNLQRLSRIVAAGGGASSSTTQLYESKESSVSPFLTVPQNAGESALQNVQWLGSRVAQKEATFGQKQPRSKKRRSTLLLQLPSNTKVQGTGGSVMSNQKRQILDYQRRVAEERSYAMPFPPKQQPSDSANNNESIVWEALANLEQDMQILDTLAGQRSQLSILEFTLLLGAVLSAAGGPLFMSGAFTELLAPSAAAFIAAIGIGAEYTGKVAVADGKEIAAAAIQCSAESEGFLAQAERAKAVTPLCVGIATTAATLALLVPVMLDAVGRSSNVQLATEANLFCPLVAILAAAVASLAFQETLSFCRQAIGVGNRRFARSGLVGRTWLSSTEQIGRKSSSAVNKWRTFSFSVLPAPLLGSMVPGALPTKTIVVAALAAAQSAYFLARAESTLSRATDAVALKCRSAAVCDTYANQGARSAAILPFTSALSGLCAAATAAIVELPFLEALAHSGSPPALLAQIATVAAFPALSALFAAAASVSKARCEVDAEACMQAASTLALPYDDEEQDPVLRPLAGVWELVRLTLNTALRGPVRQVLRRINAGRRKIQKWFGLGGERGGGSVEPKVA